MTRKEIIDLVDKYTGICDIIFSEELADALIPRIEQEKYDTLKEFVEYLRQGIMRNLGGVSEEGKELACEITNWFDYDLEQFIKEREK